MKKLLLPFLLFFLSYSITIASTEKSKLQNFKQVFLFQNELSAFYDSPNEQSSVLEEYDQNEMAVLRKIRDNSTNNLGIKIEWENDAKIIASYRVGWNNDSPKRVIYLHLSGQGLETLDLTALDKLEQLDCTYNNLTSLTISRNAILKKLGCYGNNLSLSALPPKSLVSGEYLYNPQNKNTTEVSITSGDIVDYSVEKTINSVNTNFKWYKDNLQITSVDQSGKLTVTEDGYYYCEMTNSNFQGLVVTSSLFKVGSPPIYDPSDIAVLKAIRDNAPINSDLKYLWTDESRIASWSGVEWSEKPTKKVTALYIQDGELTSLDVSQLKALKTLSCSRNKLASLNISGNINLTNLYCSGNKLPFSQLPINLPTQGGNFEYMPQEYLFNPEVITLGGTIDYSSEATIGGASTVFSWYKNNIKINGVSQTGKFSPTEEGYFYCEMTNTKFPGLLLTTNVVKLGNPPEYDPNEVAALKAIRDNAPSNSPLKTQWANDSNIGSWAGVNWTSLPSKRVKKLYVWNSLLNELDVRSFALLETLYCNNNNLSVLVTTGLNFLMELICSNNKLAFSRLPLPQTLQSNSSYTYTPQNKLYEERSIALGETIDYSFESVIGGKQTTFTWYKDNVKLGGTDQSGKYSPTSEGYYYCVMTNTGFPQLTLTTNAVKAGNLPEFSPEDIAALKSIRDNAPVNSKIKNTWADETQVGKWEGVVWSDWKSRRVISLTFYDQGVTDLDVRSLAELVQLGCYGGLNSIQVVGLTKLSEINVPNNNLNSIDISGLTNLRYINCSSNKIPMSKMPVKLPVSGGSIIYDSQKPLFDERRISLGETIDFSSEAIVANKATTFVWYKDGVKIDATDQSGKYTPNSDGYYTCEMTNSAFTVNTFFVKFKTNAVIAGNATEFDQNDVTALKSIRDGSPVGSIPRVYWTDQNNLKTWQGVIWSDSPSHKVIGLSLNSFNLTSLDVSPFQYIKNLSCSGNNLKILKLNESIKLSSLDCSRNNLKFSALPVNPTVEPYTYSYLYQNKISDDKSIQFGETIDFSSEVIFKGINTVFKWYKNNELIGSVDQTGKYTPVEEGYFYCVMTNALFPDLIIRSGLYKLGNPPDYDAKEVAALKSIRDNAPSDSPLKTEWADESKIRSWSGVIWSATIPYQVQSLSITNKKLTTLDVSAFTKLQTLVCNDNSIEKLDFGSLLELTYVDCQRNNLTSLTIGGLMKLRELNCNSNKLTFSKLPRNNSGFTYYINPQKAIFEAKTIFIGDVIDYSSEAIVDGVQTAFVWYKNGVKIAGTDQSGKYKPDSDGFYVCKMTNSIFPNLELTTSDVKVGAISEYDINDVNALKAIRDNSLANSALKTLWANDLNFTSWSGVTWSNISPRKVVYLNLQNRQLTGVVDLRDLTSLEYLNCSLNKISTLFVSGLGNLNTLSCDNNELSAIDLSGNSKLKAISCGYNCIPISRFPIIILPVDASRNQQNEIFTERTINLGESIDYSSESTLDGFTTIYTWYWGDIIISGTDQSGKYTPTKEGYYWCKMKNSRLPGLEFITKKIKVGNPSEYLSVDVDALKEIRNNAPSNSPLKTSWADDSKIGTWEGVGWTSIAPRCVTYLNIYNKQLANLNLGEFKYLKSVNCIQNKLTTLDIKGTAIDILDCNYNNLPFSKLPLELPGNGPYKSYQFAPQNLIFEEQTLSLGGTIDYSSEATISGVLSVFEWYRNGIKISGTDQSGKLTVKEDGFYHCLMTNAKFPGLILKTNIVKGGNPPDFDPQDVATLNAIRDNAPANSVVKQYWADDTNIGSWNGVTWNTIKPKKVISLSVAGWGLKALNITTLTFLEGLYCNNNELSTLDLSGLSKLRELNCSNNYLPFSQLIISLPVNNGYYTYYPQGLLYQPVVLNSGQAIDYSSEALISGISTVYTWYKNNIKIEYTNQTGIYTPTSEGYYYCVMTNSKFPKLTLTTNAVKVGNPPEYDPQDILLLKSIRDKAPANSYLKTLWADDSNIGSWQGVTWSQFPTKQVKQLNLNGAGFVSLDLSGFNSLERLECSNNNLVSLDLAVLPSLITANCSNNKLTSLNINGLTKLGELYCSGNYLRFSDLPLKLPVNNFTYNYSYQSFPYVSTPVDVGAVLDFSSETTIDGIQTKFEWFKNGTLISGTDNSGKYQVKEDGFYYCRMTNSKFPGLALITNQVKVGAVQEYYQEDVEVLKAIRDNAPANSSLKSLWRDESQIVSWFGVTWSYTLPHRVIQLSVGNMELTQLDVSKLTALTQLSCYSNKLKSINITGLSNLQNFNCNNNLLSSIDVSTNRNLQGLDCSSNLIPFSKLPFALPAGYGSINYSNQKPFSEEKSLTLGQTIDYSSEAVINGISSSFTWYRNNLKIEGTDNSGKYTPVSDGFYYCTMSNPKFTALVITTGKTIVGSPIEFNPDDIAALKSIRDNSPSDSPLRTSWADDIPVKDWRGITWNSVYPLRVEKLIVAAMRLNTLDVSLLTKLKYLDCTFNKLNKLDVSILPELSTLYCSNNQLDEIKIDKAQKISNLSCEYNRLPLSKLPLPTSTMISYRYSPQNTLYEERTINPGETIDYSSEATIDGASTVFTWFKDNIKIENTDQTGKYAPKEYGYYYCQMTNSKFVGLTLTTNFLKLGTPLEYDSRDISVLKSIRDSAPETSQLKTIWADDLPIENWLALNWSSSKPKRVTALLLNGIQLTALDVTGLNELKTINCSQCGLLILKASGLSNLSSISCNDNQLTTIDLSGNSRLTYINISNNKLTFSKIPLISVYYYTLIYSPQKEVFDAKEIKLGESINFSSEANIRGYQTNFTWFKNDVAITTIQSGTFTPTESGTYYCKMTNYAYQNLTLVTNKITVTSTSEFELADANALKAILNSAPASSPLKTEWADETQMASWKGVTWTESVPKRVKQLDVSNKNISLLEIGTLSAIESLNCSNNQITSLNIDGLNNLNNLDCSFNLLTSISVIKAPKIQNLVCNNNSIPFSALPLSLPVSAGTYKYSPMNKIDSERTILFGESINYILESKIGGIATVFSWFKNDVKINDSDQSGKYTPTDTGIFYCTMTNDKFPGLVITTNTINVIKPEEYDSDDIEALKRLRDNLPSESPLRLKWKDDNQIFSWEGVGWGSISPRKVKVLQMSSSGLKTLDLTLFANLEEIYCDNNQLTSMKLTGLLNLNYVSCAYNQLTVIDISGLPKIKNLFCQNNKLCFSKLPVKLSVIGGNYQYWPQQTVFEEQTIALGGTIDFTSEKTINGIATVFTWYKNNNVISGTDQTGKLVTSSDGFYHCVMTNANFPGLTLTTSKVITGIIYEFDPNDVKVLTTIFDNAPTNSIIRGNWKDITQIGSWYGVKWNNETPKRVTELNVSNSELTTLDITNLDKLERLNFANNRLASVNFPGLLHLKYINADFNILTSIDLSGLSEMQLLTCPGNNLTFNSLWVNKRYLSYLGAYAPQNLIYSEKNILQGEIIDYSSEAEIDGIATTFTWYRNNEKIENTDNSGKYIPTNDGYYYCSMTNSNFPGLTLFTSAVKVGTPIQFNLQDVEALKAIRDNAPSSSLLKSKWNDESKIETWEGVTWSSFYPKYVVSLSIHDAITDLDVTQISHLQELNVCSCFVLQSINISGLKELKMIDCRYNKIPFSKIPQSTSTLTCYFIPQYELYDERLMNLGEGIDYSFEQIIDGVQTKFTWYFNNTEILGTDQSGKYLPTLSGEYYCKMINSKFPGLTLQTSKITVSDKIPVAKAGNAQIVNEGAMVNLDGSLSYVKGNANLTYYWMAPSGIELSSITDAKPFFTAPEVLSDTNLTFSLVVSDGTLSSVKDQVVITVLQINKEPVANAGNSREVREGDVVELDGSGSFDVDKDALTYSWSSPSGILLSSTTDAKPTFTAPNVSDDTSYTFKLTVNDGKFNSTVSEVIIKVRKNYPKIKLVAKLNGLVIPVKDIKYQLFSEESNNYIEQSLIPEIKGDTTLFSLWAGKWIILVSPSENPALFIPTYFGDVLSWDQATIVTIPEPRSLYKEINCIQSGTATKGSGIISGFIVESDNLINKSIAIYHGSIDNKQPVKGAIINLYKKGENIPVLSTISDEKGFYKFEQLEISGYGIGVELPGFKQSEKFAVLMSDANPIIEVQFAVNTDLKVITDIESIDLANPKVYPNPVVDNLSIDLMEYTGESVLYIYNVMGKLLLKQILYERESDIDFSGYPAGIYVVKIFMNNQFKSFVIVK